MCIRHGSRHQQVQATLVRLLTDSAPWRPEELGSLTSWVTIGWRSFEETCGASMYEQPFWNPQHWRRLRRWLMFGEGVLVRWLGAERGLSQAVRCAGLLVWAQGDSRARDEATRVLIQKLRACCRHLWEENKGLSALKQDLEMHVSSRDSKERLVKTEMQSQRSEVEKLKVRRARQR